MAEGDETGGRPADPHEKAAREARRDLERLKGQGETVGTSSMARAARRAVDHLSGTDAPDNDPVEVWGTRIGRGLGAVFFVGLLIYMVVTYL